MCINTHFSQTHKISHIASRKTYFFPEKILAKKSPCVLTPNPQKRLANYRVRLLYL